MRRRLVEVVIEFVRKEARVAGPAAISAVAHGAREALKRFPQEYAKKRGRR